MSSLTLVLTLRTTRKVFALRSEKEAPRTQARKASNISDVHHSSSSAPRDANYISRDAKCIIRDTNYISLLHSWKIRMRSFLLIFKIKLILNLHPCRYRWIYSTRHLRIFGFFEREGAGVMILIVSNMPPPTPRIVGAFFKGVSESQYCCWRFGWWPAHLANGDCFWRSTSKPFPVGSGETIPHPLWHWR